MNDLKRTLIYNSYITIALLTVLISLLPITLRFFNHASIAIVMAPSLGTVFQYLLLSIPLYLFVGSPLLKITAPSYFAIDSITDYPSFEKSDSLVFPEDDLVCAPHAYNVRVLSREPLVVYIDGFLSKKEAEHLVNVAYAPFS